MRGAGGAAHMSPMTTATTTRPVSPLAAELNRHLETQPPERTLHRLDLCDRCPQAAQSIFAFTVEGADLDILLCGHHTRKHLPELLARTPVTYWIDPAELHSVRGVIVKDTAPTESGDGLTDG